MGKFKQASVVTCTRVPTVTHDLSPRTPHNWKEKLGYSNCSPEMILNIISNSVVCTFSPDIVCLMLQSTQAILLELSRARHRVSYMQNMELLDLVPPAPMCSGPWKPESFTDKCAISEVSPAAFQGSG